MRPRSPSFAYQLSKSGLWVNLNRDEFRSFRDAGRVNRVPGAMISGPASRASVIEFEAGTSCRER